MTALALCSDAGVRLPLDAARWRGGLTQTEQRLLAGLAPPVLDVGCGPGRVVEGLGRLGMAALGVDPVAAAVALAKQRGAAALRRSVFDPLPGAGRWKTVVLFDGNIGIGGDPVRLLRRCRQLLADDGSMLVELGAPGGCSGVHRVRLEHGADHGPWFTWSVVTVDVIVDVASAARLDVCALHQAPEERRWFAHLVKGTDASALP